MTLEGRGETLIAICRVVAAERESNRLRVGGESEETSMFPCSQRRVLLHQVDSNSESHKKLKKCGYLTMQSKILFAPGMPENGPGPERFWKEIEKCGDMLCKRPMSPVKGA